MPLKVCLIGAGHMGRIHAKKLAGMKDVALTCIVDINRSRAEETARNYGVKATERLEEALVDGVQGAVIATTTETHFPIARELLEGGVHVFVEKPIAADPGEAEALVELAAKNGLLLQVGHLERFNPTFRRACRSMGTPLAMEARRISGFTGRSTDIDVIHDLMIHDIDLVLSLAKADIRRISAEGTPVITKKIDVANARIEFVDGCVANLSASRASNARERRFTIVGKDRYASLDMAEGHMFSVEPDKSGKKRSKTYRVARPDPVKDELRAFVRAIKAHRRAAVDGEDGLKALIVANSISAEIERLISERKAGSVE